ncbi:hypothetical protein QT383_06585 [Stenotrophomonas rhizophila]
MEAKQDNWKIKENVALMHRSSSTDEVSMSEIAKMALDDAGSSKAPGGTEKNSS